MQQQRETKERERARARVSSSFPLEGKKKTKEQGANDFDFFEHDGRKPDFKTFKFLLLSLRVSPRHTNAHSLSRSQPCSPGRVSRGLSCSAEPRPGRLGPKQQQQLGLDASASLLLLPLRHHRLLFGALPLSSSRSLIPRQPARTRRTESSPRQRSPRRSPRRRSPGSPRRPRHSPTTTPSWRRRRRRRPISQRAASPRRATTSRSACSCCRFQV